MLKDGFMVIAVGSDQYEEFLRAKLQQSAEARQSNERQAGLTFCVSASAAHGDAEREVQRTPAERLRLRRN
jgi:hypothetical protein